MSLEMDHPAPGAMAVLLGSGARSCGGPPRPTATAAHLLATQHRGRMGGIANQWYLLICGLKWVYSLDGRTSPPPENEGNNPDCRVGKVCSTWRGHELGQKCGLRPPGSPLTQAPPAPQKGQGRKTAQSVLGLDVLWEREQIPSTEGPGASLEQAPPVDHCQEQGQEYPSSSCPEPRSPGADLDVILLLQGLRGGTRPRITLQQVDAGVLGHLDPNGIHRLVLVLLWGIVRPRVQGLAVAEGQVRRAARERLTVHPGGQTAWLAQLQLGLPARRAGVWLRQAVSGGDGGPWSSCSLP